MTIFLSITFTDPFCPIKKSVTPRKMKDCICLFKIVFRMNERKFIPICLARSVQWRDDLPLSPGVVNPTWGHRFIWLEDRFSLSSGPVGQRVKALLSLSRWLGLWLWGRWSHQQKSAKKRTLQENGAAVADLLLFSMGGLSLQKMLEQSYETMALL